MVYRLRVLYLVPYLYLAAGSLFWLDGEESVKSRGRQVGAGAVILDADCRDELYIGGHHAVGPYEPFRQESAGADRAGTRRGWQRARASLLQEPDLYFAGRALGWRRFHLFDGSWGPGLASPPFQSLLARTDVAIFRGEPDAAGRGVIEGLGFRFATVILPGGGRRSSLFGWQYGPPTYGPYFVYRRLN